LTSYKITQTTAKNINTQLSFTQRFSCGIAAQIQLVNMVKTRRLIPPDFRNISNIFLVFTHNATKPFQAAFHETLAQTYLSFSR